MSFKVASGLDFFVGMAGAAAGEAPAAELLFAGEAAAEVEAAFAGDMALSGFSAGDADFSVVTETLVSAGDDEVSGAAAGVSDGTAGDSS
ncbi:MAG TPA: hypothetical protein VGI42_02060 [Chthoniobacterales bacterium]|jgi:hypothetical protein